MPVNRQTRIKLTSRRWRVTTVAVQLAPSVVTGANRGRPLGVTSARRVAAYEIRRETRGARLREQIHGGFRDRNVLRNPRGPAIPSVFTNRRRGEQRRPFVTRAQRAQRYPLMTLREDLRSWDPHLTPSHRLLQIYELRISCTPPKTSPQTPAPRKITFRREIASMPIITSAARERRGRG